MKPLEYEAKNGKTYKITVERAPRTGPLLYGFFFKIRREEKTFCYTLGVAPVIVERGKWSEEQIREFTLGKAQRLLDEGREEKTELLCYTFLDQWGCL